VNARGGEFLWLMAGLHDAAWAERQRTVRSGHEILLDDAANDQRRSAALMWVNAWDILVRDNSPNQAPIMVSRSADGRTACCPRLVGDNGG